MDIQIEYPEKTDETKKEGGGMDFSIRRSIDGVEDVIEIKNAAEEFILKLVDKLCEQTPYGLDMDPIHALFYEKAIQEVRDAYAECGFFPDSAPSPVKAIRLPLDDETSWDPGLSQTAPMNIQNARAVRMARSPEPKIKQFKKHDGTFGDPNYSVTIDCDVCGKVSFGWAKEVGGHVKCKHCKTPLLVEQRYKEHMRADADACVFKANRPLERLQGMEWI